MPTLKKKIDILKSLENPQFDPSNIDEFLTYAAIPGMASPVLKRILSYLIECDSQVSASYELISDEDWALLVSDNMSPTDENFELKTKIDCLAMYFSLFYNILEKNEINLILSILQQIFEVKTKNIQFLIFLLAEKHSKSIFSFLLLKLKKYPLIYTPFFCSLLVRLNFDVQIKQKCFLAFKKHLISQIPSKNNSFLINFQSFLYVLCFKSFEIDEESLRFINKNSIYFHLMNKDVVLKFLSLEKIQKLKIKNPVFHSISSTCFSYFPFDLPIIPQITEKIESNFINFE
jgi:hypothetical protein